MAARSADARWHHWRDLALIAVLAALGLFYAASFVTFWVRSRDFIAALVQRDTRAGEIAVPGSVFLGGGGCFACRRSGWNAAEERWTFTRAENATLAFKLPEDAAGGERDLAISLDAAAFLPEQAKSRVLTIEANGTPIGSAEFRAGDPATEGFFDGRRSQPRVFTVPGRVVAAGNPLVLTLHMAAVGSPLQLRVSADTRPLGLAVAHVEVSFAAPATGGR